MIDHTGNPITSDRQQLSYADCLEVSVFSLGCTFFVYLCVSLEHSTFVSFDSVVF